MNNSRSNRGSSTSQDNRCSRCRSWYYRRCGSSTRQKKRGEGDDVIIVDIVGSVGLLILYSSGKIISPKDATDIRSGDSPHQRRPQQVSFFRNEVRHYIQI